MNRLWYSVFVNQTLEDVFLKLSTEQELEIKEKNPKGASNVCYCVRMKFVDIYSTS